MKRLLGILALAATVAFGGMKTLSAAETCTCNCSCSKAKTTASAALPIYPAEVNYDSSVASGVLAGKYDWTDSDVNDKNFPASAPRTNGKLANRKMLDVMLVSASELTNKSWISTEDALAELDRRGYRPLNVKELLAFGAKYPDEQRKYPIIALGSVWQDRYGFRFVPYLHRFGSGRYLILYWFDSGWHGHCRFAAVRK